MRNWLRFLMFVFACAATAPTVARAQVRIKDVTEFEGTHSTKLLGIGLVVGLNGTGGKSTLTQEMATHVLQRFNIGTRFYADIRGASVYKSQNVAVVAVTAELNPFAREGGRLDVRVATYDDATSIDKGVLLPTMLKGLDGLVYASASGPVHSGGYLFTTSGGGTGTAASAGKNHPTVGIITNGAEVFRRAPGKVVCNGQAKITLRSPDFGTATAVAKAVNKKFPNHAFPIDKGTVFVLVPPELCQNAVSFLNEISSLEIQTDMPARVVVNERTGTIVMGHKVRISPAAITTGSLTVVATNTPEVSQPLPFSKGKTTVVPRGQVGVTEKNNILSVLEQKDMTVGDLARALNALGASPRELIPILENLKTAGALHAELVFQ